MEGGEEEDNTNNSGINIIAPFVVKTYQMVNDPTTVNLIKWGRADNSFIVVHPLHFSHRLLPLYFKHNNFSSFIRQLNTYGFRKVDPDRWEFANEWFLRGKTQLLKNIARKKQSKNDINYSIHHKLEEDEEDMLMEITRLKQEQEQLDLQVEGMNKRLQATERRPQQVKAFIYKLVADPQILSRMMATRVTDKNRRLMLSSSSSEMVMTSSVNSEEAEEIATVGTTSSSISSPEANLDGLSSPETMLPMWFNQRQAIGRSLSAHGAAGIGDLSYVGGGAAWGDSSPPPYPFSLLGGGF